MVAPPAPNWIPTSGLAFRPGALDALDEAQHVVGGDADEAGRDLEDVEAHAGDLVDVALDGVGALGEDVLDEPAGGDEHVVLVGDLDDLAQGRLGHQRERAAGELQRVDVLAHRVEHVLEVARSHDRVVGPRISVTPRVRGFRGRWFARRNENASSFGAVRVSVVMVSPSSQLSVRDRLALGAGS